MKILTRRKKTVGYNSTEMLVTRQTSIFNNQAKIDINRKGMKMKINYSIKI